MSLEPSHVLLMVPPALLLELSRSKILSVGSLLVVEDEEEAVCSELFEDLGIVEDWAWGRGIAAWGGVWVPWCVASRSFAVGWCWYVSKAVIEGW